MNNDNQYDDLEDLHRKPLPNNLPPIWDNIAGALDADDVPSIEEQLPIDTASEHAQQVADFSVIKAGFVAAFAQQEPPKFLWDTIEQDLEAQVPTDAPTEFSTIKESFVAAFGKQQPPQYLWKELVERVDQPEKEIQEREKANYSKIKKSFERKYSATVVPLFSWEDLAERMDAEAILADTLDRFSCIKESFEVVYGKEEPHYQVAKSLWAALYPLRPVSTVFQQCLASPWTKRIGGALLLLLVLLMNYSIYPSSNTNLTDVNSETAVSLLPTRTAFSSDQDKTTFPKELMQLMPWKRQENSLLAQASATQKASNLSAPLSTNSNSSWITSPTLINTLSPFSKTNKASVSSSMREEPVGVALEKKKANASARGSSVLEHNEQATVPPSKESNIALPNQVLNPESMLGANPTTLPTPVLSAVEMKLMEEEGAVWSTNYISNPAISRMENQSFREVRPFIRGKRMHFEFGVETRVGTSVFLEKKTEERIKEKLLCPTGAVGVNFQYYFGKNDALVLGAYPYSSTIQCWIQPNPNQTGYQETSLNLSFLDFTFGYQRVLFRYRSFTEAPASVYAQVNLGVGWLTGSTTSVNHQTIYAPDLYENLNFSAGLAVGSLHKMQRFVLDYGLIGNIGLNKVVTGVEPSISRPARIVNLGAYIGLRYLFMPRRAPSKKQRQFDWSAPFYIEEPTF